MYGLLSKCKVLIIDDFAQFRATMKAMVHKLGARNIDLASDAAEAMKYCLKTDYDIILCDYNLGQGQDGQQFMEELHQRSILLKGCLFVMVTAETTSAQVMGAIDYRPDAYLTKPFTSDLLAQRLKRLMHKNEKLFEIHRAMNKGDSNRALQLCDSVMLETPNLRFSCLRLKSELLEQQTKYDELKVLFDEVITEQPLLWAVVGIGKIYFEQEDYGIALDHFLEMRENFPQQVTILDWIARCQQKLGAIQEAENTLREAIDISPKSVSRQARLGELAQSLEHHDIAQKAFQKTIDEGYNSCLLEPQHYQQYYDNSQKIASQLDGREQSRLFSQCEHIAHKMEQKYCDDPGAMASNLSSLVNLFSSSDQTQKAEDYLSKLAVNLENPKCRVDEKEYQKIQENLKSIGDRLPGGKTLNKIGARMETIHEQVAVNQVNDKSARSCNREGMGFANQKQAEAALLKFREAIELNPRNPDYALNATQIILTDETMKHDPKFIDEAKTYLQSITLEQSGTRWRLFKKLNSMLHNA
jgi:CheY-like chemotaxis protein/cytochrome c-type biogenesis protein CcmH/NrfG